MGWMAFGGKEEVVIDFLCTQQQLEPKGLERVPFIQSRWKHFPDVTTNHRIQKFWILSKENQAILLKKSEYKMKISFGFLESMLI